MTQSRRYLLLFFASHLLSVAVDDKSAAQAQSLPPASFNGFVYPGESVEDPILIQAFVDPLCPDSRDTWPALKRALQYYGSLVRCLVHLLPLPFHDNAYLASRALHVANTLNDSSTFPLLEQFFKHQDYFSNERTNNMSRLAITKEVVEFTAKIVGEDLSFLIESYFEEDEELIGMTRSAKISFKYSARTGVYAAPTFLVNGFMLPRAGSPLDYSHWRNILDPLKAQKNRIPKMKYEA